MNQLPIVTVSEVNQFRECRRAWYLNNVRSLQPLNPIDALWMGDGIHQALHVYWTSRNVIKAHNAYLVWYIKQEQELQERFGANWEGDYERKYVNMAVLAEEMLVHYDEYIRELEAQGTTWRPITLEKRVVIPIHNSDGDRTLKGTPCLSGKMDMVAEITIEGVEMGIAVIDYKTAKGKGAMTHGEALDLDEQLTGYSYIYWRTDSNHDVPHWAIHENLVKAVPKPPAVNKDGSLSVNKYQRTTYAMYVEAMVTRGISLEHPRYRAYLATLKETGKEAYFFREASQRNVNQVENYERRLFYTYQQMRQAAMDDRYAYAEPSPMKCRQCPYISVCHAMEDGGDAEALIEQNFKVKPRDKGGEVIPIGEEPLVLSEEIVT